MYTDESANELLTVFFYMYKMYWFPNTNILEAIKFPDKTSVWNRRSILGQTLNKSFEKHCHTLSSYIREVGERKHQLWPILLTLSLVYRSCRCEYVFHYYALSSAVAEKNITGWYICSPSFNDSIGTEQIAKPSRQEILYYTVLLFIFTFQENSYPQIISCPDAHEMNIYVP